MRALEWSKAVEVDPISALHLVDRPSLSLPPGWVKVSVRAVSLNYRDLLVIKGLYGAWTPDAGPLTVGSDMAGVVLEAGAGVTAWNPGDRVTCSFFSGWLDGPYRTAYAGTALGAGATQGVLAEEVVLPAAALVQIPHTLSFVDASALPCAGVTAWNALFEGGDIRPGGWVAVVGTGGVAAWTIQLAQAAGMRVAVVSSDERKLAQALLLGAEVSINRTHFPAWGAEVAARTGGADLVVDAAGASTLNESMRAARDTGQVAMVGVVAGMSAAVDTIEMIVKRLRIRGVNVGSREHLAQLVRMVAGNRLRPHIDSVHLLGDYRSAFGRLASSSHVGKVVIQLGNTDQES